MYETWFRYFSCKNEDFFALLSNGKDQIDEAAWLAFFASADMEIKEIKAKSEAPAADEEREALMVFKVFLVHAISWNTHDGIQETRNLPDTQLFYSCCAELRV